LGQLHAQADLTGGFAGFNSANGFMRKQGFLLRGNGCVDGCSGHGVSSSKLTISQKTKFAKQKKFAKDDHLYNRMKS
jgi:hypothetical protein